MMDLVFELPMDEERLRQRLLPRKVLFDRSLIQSVSSIFQEVEESGDHAIKAATQRFDLIDIQAVKVSEEFVERSVSGLSPQFRDAVDVAINNIAEVNRALMPDLDWRREIRPGTVIGEKSTPLESVALYVPARKAPLVSTALMLVTAARVAGVHRIVVGMPPQQDGQPNASTVAAAKLAGATEFVVGNGVAVIAGLTIGTESTQEVNAIYGPGPAGIAAAMSVAFSYGKRTVVGIGPTDCAIIADGSADPEWIARNLMCEGEHGPDSSVLLATTSRALADNVAQVLEQRIPLVREDRRDVLTDVFGAQGMGSLVVCPDTSDACRVINEFAPEHLMLACPEGEQEKVLSMVVNAGEILLGHFTPFSAANYAIGITAVLPTNGFARIFSGITCKDMLKTSTVGGLNESALMQLGVCINQLGEHEGLPCHAAAAAR